MFEYQDGSKGRISTPAYTNVHKIDKHFHNLGAILKYKYHLFGLHGPGAGYFLTCQKENNSSFLQMGKYHCAEV